MIKFSFSKKPKKIRAHESQSRQEGDKKGNRDSWHWDQINHKPD